VVVDGVNAAPRAGQHVSPSVAVPVCEIDACLANAKRRHLRVSVSDDYCERLQELSDGLPIAGARLQRETMQSNHAAWRRLRGRWHFPDEF